MRGVLAQHGVQRRHQKQRKHRRHRKAADDRARQRQIGFTAFAQPQRHRQQADNGRDRRHQDRAQPGLACLHGGFDQRLPASPQHVGKVHQQHAVTDHDADHHDHAHEAIYRQSRAGQIQRQHHSRQAQRHAAHDHQRLEQRLKLRGQHHVHQRYREQPGKAQARERLLLRLALTTQTHREAVGWRQRVDRQPHGLAGFAQAFAQRHVGGDIDHTLHVLARNLHRPTAALHRRNRRQRHHRALRRPQHQIIQVRDLAAIRIGHAHVDKVLVAGLRIGVAHRRKLRVSDQARQHRLRHLLLAQPQHARLFAIDLDIELGIILLAGDLYVGQQRLASGILGRPHLGKQLARVLRRLVGVVAQDLDIDGSGRAKVEDALDDAAGKKERLDAGEAFAQGRAQLVDDLHITDVALQLGQQVYLQVANVRPGVAGKQRRASTRQPQVRDHRRIQRPFTGLLPGLRADGAVYHPF